MPFSFLYDNIYEKTKELKMIAEVIINSNVKSLNKTFDYAVPERLETVVKVGTRVCVPFGNSKKVQDRVYYSVLKKIRAIR